MLKKSLLSLAVTASVVGLSGCNISSTTDSNEVNNLPLEAGTPEYIAANAATLGTTYPLFNPAKTLSTGLPEIPVTSDLLFKGDPDGDGFIDTDADGVFDFGEGPTKDGTIPLAFGDPALGSATYNPIFSAAADLDGFSTSAQIDIPFSAGLTASSVIGSGADASVFIIPLDYSGEDPLFSTLTPTPGAPVAIDASVITFSDTASTTTASVGTGNVLRISPTAPLNPATRYMIVLTDAITDANGKAVIASPTYTLLSSPTDFLTAQDEDTLAKASLQDAIQGYEALAAGYFGAAGLDYTADNIVYSFSFTTGGTTAVLNSMAAPANFVASAVSAEAGAAFNISLPAKYRYAMEVSLQANSGDMDGGITAAVTDVYTDLATDAGGSDAVAIATLAALGADATAQQTSIGGLATIHKHIPSPAPRESDFSGGGAALDLGTTLNGAIGTNLGLSGTIRVSNGTIKLPQYSASADLTSTTTYMATASNVFDFWGADGSLGTDLSAVLTAAGVPSTAVAAPSTNVTRLFPLAELVEYREVPVTVIYDTACAGNVYTPVIFQHGITADRTSSFMPAASLAAADDCVATVAIDLPQHGLTDDATVSPVSSVTLGAVTAANGETINDQRHFGLKRVPDVDASTPFPMDDTKVSDLTTATKALNAASLSGDALTAADAQADGVDTLIKAQAGKRGDFFVNLESFQSTRDNMRQAVMDLLNLNASLAFMDFNNDGSDSFDTTNVHFIGHSLGAILGTNFVAVNNSVGSGVANCATCSVVLPEIQSATLANPGAGVVALLENSGSFASTIVGGIEALGTASGLDLEQGSFLYELTKNIFQATVDSADSINFAGQLTASGTPVLTLQVVGDGTVDNPSDQTIPSNALPGNTATSVNTFPSLPAYLSGSDPLITALGQSQVDATVDTSAALNSVIKFTDGEHGSFAGSDATSGNGVFSEMMTQLFTFINSDGQDITVTDATVVQTAP